jgi:hypothetical protein
MEFALYQEIITMLKIFLFLCCLSAATGVRAFQKDTSAYQTQRLRINALLAERSSKFGQYELSLNSRTGIFGMQTKEDIRNSNEILRGIILSDNNIFRELKILMNYKDQEVEQAQANAVNTKRRIESYMLTIKRLQDQNEKLKSSAGQSEQKKGTATYVIIFLSTVILIGGSYFYQKISATKNAIR